MGVDFYPCGQCATTNHSDSCQSCHNCGLHYCNTDECAGANIIQYAEGMFCSACDPHCPAIKADALLEWVIQTYLPNKDLSALKAQFQTTLAVKPIQCFNCRTIACESVGKRSYDYDFPTDLRKSDFNMKLSFTGCCCKCGMEDEPLCSKCQEPEPEPETIKRVCLTSTDSHI